ncbi:MAG: hypothetical protein WDN45_14730 [Caulobacteraceae bacterium]
MGKRQRTAWATALSLVLHVLMLAGMVLGLKVVQPPPEGRALEFTLVRPIERVRVPASPTPAPPQAIRAPPPQLHPHVTPQPPVAPAPGVALPEARTPAPAPTPRVYGPLAEGGVKPSLSGRMGCDDDPLRRRQLDEDQKQTCANNLTARAKAAPPLSLIPDDKLAEYERNTACRRNYTKQAIPRLTDQTNTSVAENLPTAMPSGLGSVPAPKDCGFGQR